eukprot:g7623.t1
MPPSAKRDSASLDPVHVLLVIACLAPALWYWAHIKGERGLQRQLCLCAALAGLGFFLTAHMIPPVMRKVPGFLTGKDLCKKGTPRGETPVPESMGIVSGTVFLICLIFCEVYYATTDKGLVEYCSAILSICFMLFLGLADDILDLPWRAKLIIPPVASLPLLCSYSGGTSIVLPKPARPFVFDAAAGELTAAGRALDLLFAVDPHSQGGGAVVDLGAFYLLYMLGIGVFCTNAINIYAGINGLEAGQSFVIACGILAHNLLELGRDAGDASDYRHLFSAFIMMPFICTTLGLLKHNWFPSDVFVGDTFCYYAGMTFAVVGILGHFSKTLLLFFLPQLLNFVISLPQLAKVVPCPRHRLPAYNAETGLLEPSRTVPGDNSSLPNFTVINFFLVAFGPMRERTLCIALLTFQVLCCVGVFVVRYHLAQFFYDE